MQRDDGLMGLDIIKSRVNREIEKGWIGPDRSCEYYPCHYDGMDCTFCYCPFFPCRDPRYGRYVENPKLGQVWDCSDCLMIHHMAVCKHVIARMREMGITQCTDPRIGGLFDEAAEIYERESSP